MAFALGNVESGALLERLRAFWFPLGEDSARVIRAIRTKEKGFMRMSPEAHWFPFTAEQVIHSTCSSFRWEARLDPGKLTSPSVIDAYAEGHGQITVKLGVISVRKVTGAEVDKGEMQRYLSSIILFPPILLNHPALECVATGPLHLRLRDRNDETGAAVDLEISEQGCPLVCRADRPRMVGKQAVVTPWSATCSDFYVRQGMRLPGNAEALWHLPQGSFSYYRSEIISYEAVD